MYVYVTRAQQTCGYRDRKIFLQEALFNAYFSFFSCFFLRNLRNNQKSETVRYDDKVEISRSNIIRGETRMEKEVEGNIKETSEIVMKLIVG